MSESYGLRVGQIRGNERCVHNGVWFNRQWQKLGWGDLTETDLVQVAKEIPFGEVFIVLNEHATLAVVTPLTPMYGIEHCSWVIEHGCIYAVSESPIETTVQMHGVRCRRVNRDTVKRIIARIGRLNSR